MDRIRNTEWVSDVTLKDELNRLILEGYTQKEIICYMNRDFNQYAWSERTLKRRISHFELRKADTENTLEEATEAIEKEILNGPGRLLGYRAMHQKLKKVRYLFIIY